MNSYKPKQRYLFFLIMLFCACTHDKQIDVSNVQLELKIERFDQRMQTLTAANLAAKAPQLERTYGTFYDDYMERMLEVGSTADTSYYTQLRTVLGNAGYKELQSAVATQFKDFSPTEAELMDAFKHIRYYFPQQKIPRIITFFSGFAVQTPIGNDYIGIGLDMFLGAGSKFYPSLVQSIPLYISRRFTPQNITPRTIEAFLREEVYPEKDEERSLLAKMVYNGKILCLMDAVMPNVADSLKIGYTTAQAEWCRSFEGEIWAYYLENDLLFETDYLKIQKYLTEAPFTPGLGSDNQSAPKLAVWTGWQMVKKYLEKNPDITLTELLAERDPQKILKASGYKPK